MTATKFAACAALVLFSSGAAQAQVAKPAVSQPDASAVSALTASVQQGLAALPATATAADMEAAIAFAVSQSGQPRPVVLAALQQVSSPSAKAREAIRNYLKKFRRNGGESGTGALAQERTNMALGLGPSGGGGGTSDYSRRP